MNRMILLTGTVLLTLITAVPASAANKHAVRYRRAPVQHLMPRPYGGVQQPRMLDPWKPRMLNPWICIGPCRSDEPPPPYFPPDPASSGIQ